MALHRHRVPATPHEPASPQLDAAAAAFDEDWEARNRFLANSPITAFLEVHEAANSPNELVITGAAGVSITLGDLRTLVRNLK